MCVFNNCTSIQFDHIVLFVWLKLCKYKSLWFIAYFHLAGDLLLVKLDGVVHYGFAQLFLQIEIAHQADCLLVFLNQLNVIDEAGAPLLSTATVETKLIQVAAIRLAVPYLVEGDVVRAFLPSAL